MSSNATRLIALVGCHDCDRGSPREKGTLLIRMPLVPFAPHAGVVGAYGCRYGAWLAAAQTAARSPFHS